MRTKVSRHPASVVVHGLLVATLLVFGNTCARGALECAAAGPQEEHAAAAATATTDHDADPDGCDRNSSAPCNHPEMCCSTWAAPPAAPWLDLPQAAALAPVLLVPSLAPGAVLAALSVPVPTESPPPPVSFLRL